MISPTGITAIGQRALEWALKSAGRHAGLTDGIFPLGYPAAERHKEYAADANREVAMRERLGIQHGEVVVVFVGTFVSSFEFETVMRAARDLQSEQARLRFVFVGAGGYEDRMRSLGKDLSWTKR